MPTSCVTHKPYVDNHVFTPLSRKKGDFYSRVFKHRLDKHRRFDLSKPLCRQCLQPLTVKFNPQHVVLTCEHLKRPCTAPIKILKRLRQKTPYRFIWRDFYCPKVEYLIDPAGTSDAFHYRLAFDRGDDVLMRHQSDTYSSSKTFDKILRDLASRLSVDLNYDPLVSAIQYALDETHPKYKLRMRTLLETMANGDWNTFNRCLMEKVTAKEKREWAKYGKFMRLICDLTCAGSLVGGFMAKVIKNSMSKVEFADQQWEFVGEPRLSHFQRCFETLCTTDTFKFVFFSDDSCAGIKCSDGRVIANMDIKSADASAGPSVFESLRYITRNTPFKDIMDASIKQCEKPLALSNPYYSYKTMLEPSRPVLYSGSVLTTLVNNMGNLLIYSSIKDWLDSLGRLPTVSECLSTLPRLAESAGYQVTVEVCDCPSDLQFLKYSPGRDYLPFLNLGVMLRSLGSSDGDLPGKLSEALCNKRDAEIVAGFVHAGDNFLTRTLRGRFPNAKVAFYKNYTLANTVGDASRDVGDYEVRSRYNLSENEANELVQYIHSMGIGYSVDCAAVRKILSKDYGYSYT